jgi:uncharacterized protein YcsI (UPF0317 family)
MVVWMRVPRVESLSQAKFYLRAAMITMNPRYVDAVIDYFMRSETECPIAEYLSIVSTYIRHGKLNKARQMIREILDFLDGSCSKKDK